MRTLNLICTVEGSAYFSRCPNITIVPLPPKRPELSPVENIWQFMRDNCLSNRIFKSYEEICPSSEFLGQVAV